MNRQVRNVPPVAERIKAAIRNAGLIDNAWCLCVCAAMMDGYEQCSGSGILVARFTTFDTRRDYVLFAYQFRYSTSWNEPDLPIGHSASDWLRA